MRIDLNEEIIDGYKVTTFMKQVWAKEIDLLEQFDTVCKNAGLRYWAAYGTMLGAVRHKGFIPWDDDIDVFMMRSDFNKLMEIGPDLFAYPYFLQNAYTDNYGFNFAKLRNSNTTGIEEINADMTYNQGIFIDIWPLDSTKDGSNHMNNISAIKKDIWTCIVAKSTVENNINDPNIRDIFKVDLETVKEILAMDVREKMHLFDDFCQNHEDDSEKINCWTFEVVNNPAIYERDWFRKTFYMDFYGINLPIPEGYDKILTQDYGDWQTPKQEKNLHAGIIFEPNIPYKETLSKLRHTLAP